MHSAGFDGGTGTGGPSVAGARALRIREPASATVCTNEEGP
jgi:hypothetical protein